MNRGSWYEGETLNGHGAVWWVFMWVIGFIVSFGLVFALAWMITRSSNGAPSNAPPSNVAETRTA